MDIEDYKTDPLNVVAPADVRRGLKRILRSRSFMSSPRLSDFLCFTVERALSEAQPVLKEYTIATEVYGAR